MAPLIDAERPSALFDTYLRAAAHDRRQVVQDLHGRLQKARVLRIDRALGVDSGAMLVEVEVDVMLSPSVTPSATRPATNPAARHASLRVPCVFRPDSEYERLGFGLADLLHTTLVPPTFAARLDGVDGTLQLLGAGLSGDRVGCPRARLVDRLQPSYAGGTELPWQTALVPTELRLAARAFVFLCNGFDVAGSNWRLVTDDDGRQHLLLFDLEDGFTARRHEPGWSPRHAVRELTHLGRAFYQRLRSLTRADLDQTLGPSAGLVDANRVLLLEHVERLVAARGENQVLVAPTVELTVPLVLEVTESQGELWVQPRQDASAREVFAEIHARVVTAGRAARVRWGGRWWHVRPDDELVAVLAAAERTPVDPPPRAA